MPILQLQKAFGTVAVPIDLGFHGTNDCHDARKQRKRMQTPGLWTTDGFLHANDGSFPKLGSSIIALDMLCSFLWRLQQKGPLILGKPQILVWVDQLIFLSADF